MEDEEEEYWAQVTCFFAIEENATLVLIVPKSPTNKKLPYTQKNSKEILLRIIL